MGDAGCEDRRCGERSVKVGVGVVGVGEEVGNKMLRGESRGMRGALRDATRNTAVEIATSELPRFGCDRVDDVKLRRAIACFIEDQANQAVSCPLSTNTRNHTWTRVHPHTRKPMASRPICIAIAHVVTPLARNGAHLAPNRTFYL